MPAKGEKSRSPEEKLLHILQHPLRKRLLRLYVEEEGMLSPKELADFTKRHLSNVGYHVRVLAEQGAGRKSGGLGGTADVVSFAHDQEVPVKVIWPPGATRGIAASLVVVLRLARREWQRLPNESCLGVAFVECDLPRP